MCKNVDFFKKENKKPIQTASNTAVVMSELIPPVQCESDSDDKPNEAQTAPEQVKP